MSIPVAEGARFSCTQRQLTELMDFHDRSEGKAMTKLARLDGTLGLAGHLDTNLKLGLSNSAEDIALRRRVFGKNYIDPIPPKSFFALMLDAIQDKVLLVLILAAFVSIILGLVIANDEQRKTAWVDGVAILIAVVIVVLVTAINDWTKERQFRGLQQKLETTSKYTVLRNDGQRLEMVAAEIVVGDIIEFKTGNKFPCDGILVHGSDVVINESALTGETLGLKKSVNKDVFLYGGTQVMEGTGRMLATAVGPHSQQGIILTLLNDQSEELGFIAEAVKKVWVAMSKAVSKRRQSQDVESVVSDENEKQVKVVAPSDEKGGEEEEEEEHYGLCQRIWCCICIKRKQKKRAKSKSPEKKSQGSVLQKKLNKLALQIGYGGMVAAAVCVIVLVIRFCIEEYGLSGRGYEPGDAIRLLRFFISGVTVLVVAIPEGLPLAVTIALAYSVKKMLRDNNLVRHLHSCETMGNASCICSDKTGTLTTNKMTVVDSYFASSRYTEYSSLAPQLSSPLLDCLKLNISLNSNFSSKLDLVKDSSEDLQKNFIVKGFEALVSLVSPRKAEAAEDGVCDQQEKEEQWSSVNELDIRGGRVSQIGNATECALLGLLVEMGIDYRTFRVDNPQETFVKVFTFNANRKSMSTVIRRHDNTGYRLLTKGASEIVLKKCSKQIGPNGEVLELSDEDKKNIIADVVQNMAQNALRTLCLAYRDFPADGGAGEGEDEEPPQLEVVSAVNWDDEDEVVTDLTLIGIVGIEDPVRPEVVKSIAQCQQSGITVRMVTGDNVETARAIAEKCGIIAKGDRTVYVMEGSVFKKKVTDEEGLVSQEQLDRYWPRLRVLARSSPQDKYTLVDGIIASRLTKKREVVAVTGDGTNDGPALKRADVGFAMGIAGTDVAKEASDIIITDDNFASIVKAVKWGRNVYDSISKFLQFQLTVNVVAVLLVLIGSFSIGDTPLHTIQLLWVNLIMDTFGSLALATEEPTDELLKRKPYGRKKPLVSGRMAVFIAGHSIYQLTILCLILYLGELWFDIDSGRDSVHDVFAPATQHFTIIFNTFVFMQIFNEFNARRIHGEQNVFSGIHRNFIFIGILVMQVTLQIFWVSVPGVQILFKSTQLDIDQWMWCIFLGSVELVWGQLLSLIPVEIIPNLREVPCRPESDVQIEDDEIDYDDPLEPTKARVLWLKSLNRLRTQIRVVNAFKSSVDPAEHMQYPSTPRPARYYGDTMPRDGGGGAGETQV